MINWKKCAEYDLRDYRAQKEAIINLQKKIRIVEETKNNNHRISYIGYFVSCDYYNSLCRRKKQWICC